MEAETRTALGIFTALVVAVALTVGWWALRQARRPHLVAVQVVFRGPGEGVASDAFRSFPAGSTVEAAALLTYRRGGGPLEKLCAFAPVQVGGQLVPARPISSWPASGGELRASWYTVEPSLLAWREVGAESADKLAYRDFLAPELGRELVTRLDLAARNDDFLARTVPGNAIPAGPFRLKVRVGSYRTSEDLLATESVSSPGADQVFSGAVPKIVVEFTFPPGINPGLSAHLRLGCFTFRPEVWPEAQGWPLPLSPAQLVLEGFVTTPLAFAAAAGGGTALDPGWGEPVELVAVGTEFHFRRSGGPLRWGVEVRAGDVLHGGGMYLVLLEDDGDGTLSMGDTTIFAWEEPARVAPLALALSGRGGPLALLRRVR